MELIKIVAIGIIASILALTIKAWKPEISIQITIVAGIVLFLIAVSKLSILFDYFSVFAQNAGINNLYSGILLKVTGVAYITEFGAEICKDAGENSIASKIELAGRILIAVLAVPILGTLLELITGML